MQIIEQTLGSLEIGPATSTHNLEIYPVFGPTNGRPDYLTLDEALESEEAEVTEVSDDGSVLDLLFKNHGSKPILLLDGEELIGAKQNRVLNVTVMAPAGKDIVIPVSCVEAGRWSRGGGRFSTSNRVQSAGGRSRKMADVTLNMREHGNKRGDQSGVWDDIDELANRLEVRSETSAMSDIFESHADALEEYVRAIHSQEGQIGAIFAIDGDIVGFDLLDHPRTLATILDKLAHSYAMEAISRRAEASHEANGGRRSSARPLIEEFLAGLRTVPMERFPAVGEGEDLRVVNDTWAGGALVVDGRVVHLSVMKADGIGGRRSRET